MKMRLFNFWESIRTSFWFIPVLMVLTSIGLSFVMVAIDREVQLDAYRVFGFLYTIGPEGARSILSTIAGSMITVAGVVFSITIVSLTLASSQFGPRLLRNFMQDRGNQVVLGTFIATFIYCLLVLRSVHAEGDQVFVPSLAVTFAVVLALLNVGILIYFIHHISTSIQADRVVAIVCHDLEEHLQRLFPKELGQEIEDSENDKGREQLKENNHRQVHNIAASQSGYLRTIDNASLLQITSEHDLVVHLQYRPGEFIIAGSIIIAVNCVEPLDEILAGRIANCFNVGANRTPEQDAEFAIHQLVEVAVRALSTGINDPFTAVTCIDRLGSALCYLTNREFPSSCHYDDEGKLRVVAKPVTFAGIINAAFDQIRQYGCSSAAVTIRLLEILTTISAQARHPEQQQAILRQADMIERASHQSLPEKHDREDVQQRYQALLAILNEHNTDNNPGLSSKI